MRTNPIRLLVATAAVAAAAVTAPAGPALGDGPDMTRIQVPAGNRMFLAGHATGVQIYACTATESGPAWQLRAPDAVLRDDKGKLVATHDGGPTWEARDGSRVKGARVDGITVDPSAIPWLLIRHDASSAGPDGDRLTHTTFIQRLATTGGLPPAAETCSSATLGATESVPYTADYTFWRRDRS
jgi:hypothetical protein